MRVVIGLNVLEYQRGRLKERQQPAGISPTRIGET